MKVKFFILLFIFINIQSFAQHNNNDFPKKYRTLFLGFGPRTLDTEPGTISLRYIDESPSMDNIQTSIEVKDKYNKIGFQVGFEWGRYSGLSHSILFDISLGQHRGGIFTYSLGYNFPFKISNSSLLIRPSIFGGFGNFGFEIGKLINNAGYIQVNGNKYYGESIDVSLSSQVFLYGPQIDVFWMITDNFSIFTSVNYDISSKNSRPEVQFVTNEENEISTSIKIGGDNPLVTYNNNKLTTLPYDVSGLRLTLGVAYVWNVY